MSHDLDDTSPLVIKVVNGIVTCNSFIPIMTCICYIRHLKVPLAKKNLFKKSFIPSAILILNAKF